MRDFLWHGVLMLDHFKLFGHDWVTYAQVSLKPDGSAQNEGKRVFDLELKTDYLIFQYLPLHNLRARAKLSPNGLGDLVAHWGQVSELRGQVHFGRFPELDLTLRTGPLPLKGLESFGLYPLPHSLDGTLEGHLELKGPMDKPNVSGVLAVDRGLIGSLAYDRAVIRFQGQLPYLLIEDSKIWKSKNGFSLSGGFDFSLRNFLRGIHVENSEQVVLWRGLELNAELEDPLFPVHPGDFAPMEGRILRAGSQTVGLSRLEAEYKLGERTSLQMTAEEDQAQTEYVAAGPKMRF